MHGEHVEVDADVRAVALAITLGVQHDELDVPRPQLARAARAGERDIPRRPADDRGPAAPAGRSDASYRRGWTPA